MESRYDAFKRELDLLMIKHNVELNVAEDYEIEVRDSDNCGDDMFFSLTNCIYDD